MATTISFQEQIEIPFFQSLGEFRDWATSDDCPEKVRIDYIAGRVEVDMSPEDLFTHGNLKTRMIRVLDTLVDDADLTRIAVRTNEPGINASVQNVQASTESLKSMLDDINKGKGPAGTLLRDDRVATNLTLITENLSVTSSNLNRLGLWGILWAKKAPRTNSPVETSAPLTAPKHPY